MNHRKSRLRMFFERMRAKRFGRQLSEEIYFRIFPHLRNESDYSYPFATHEELVEEVKRQKSEFLRKLEIVEQQAAHMGTSYAESFRYMLYQDLGQKLTLYSQEGERHVERTCDPRFVAESA